MEKIYPHIYPRFNRVFFKDFWQLVKPYWKSDDKKKAYLYLIINLFCSFSGVYTSVKLNSVTKVMFDALSEFNKPLLIQSSLHFLGLAALIFFCAGYGSYFSGLLSMRWQKWLTQQTVNDWLGQHKHFKLNWLNQRVDNPDQRITEDLGALPGLTLKVFFLLLNSISSFISFSVILWSLSSHFPLMLGHIQIMIPGYLFFSATLYGVLGLWLMGVIGRKLSALEYRQQIFSADFRARLLRIREFGEQISLFRGEMTEKNKLDTLFARIYDNFLQANHLRKNLLFFTIGFEILTQIVGIFLAMPLFLAKKVQYGGMMQISGAFVSVVRAFSNIMDAFSSLAELKAVVFRLTEFKGSLAKADLFLQEGFIQNTAERPEILVKNLRIENFDGQMMQMIENMHFQAPHRYLITGVSGSGKSTFLKTILGLWPYAFGEITRPHLEQIFMLPQRSYLPYGTLREVLIYPSAYQVMDDELKHWLVKVGLKDFANLLDQEANWSQIFSMGQQQLIGFIRLFLARPQIIMLDESTSALDEESQAYMYQLVDELFAKACVITIGHRQSLQALHAYQFNMQTKEKVLI